NADPTITSVAPNSRGQGATSQNVVINGTNSAAGVGVSFSGSGITINSTTRNSVSKITVNVTIGSGAPVGPQDVTVTNLDAGTATLASGVTINAGPAISSVVPNTQARGTTQSITINGSGFVTGATVVISGTKITESAATVGGGGTTLTLSVTVQSGATVGLHNLTVTNPDAGTVTLVNGYTIT